MAARNWRTIDIDALDPEGQLTADELVDPDPRSPQEAASQAKSKSSDVRGALQRLADNHATPRSNNGTLLIDPNRALLFHQE
jgi:hypothetical protein